MSDNFPKCRGCDTEIRWARVDGRWAPFEIEPSKTDGTLPEALGHVPCAPLGCAMSRRAQLAMVHIARKDLGLDEDLYRDVLERVAGKRSAGELSDYELTLVIADFRRRGWAPKPKAEPATARKAPATKKSECPQVRKVWALWAAMCKDGIVREPTRAACRAFVKRMTGVADPEWLSPEQAGVVIEALKAWRHRETGNT